MNLHGTIKRSRGLFALGLLCFFLAEMPLASANVIHIEINDLTIAPQKATARVGDTLQWDNKDFVAHTATARTHEWDVMLPAHGTGSVKLEKPGRIDYYCKFHPMMKAEVEIKP